MQDDPTVSEAEAALAAMRKEFSDPASLRIFNEVLETFKEPDPSPEELSLRRLRAESKFEIERERASERGRDYDRQTDSRVQGQNQQEQQRIPFELTPLELKGPELEVGRRFARKLLDNVEPKPKKKSKSKTKETFHSPAFKAIADYELCVSIQNSPKLCLAALVITMGRLLIPFASLKLPGGKD